MATATRPARRGMPFAPSRRECHDSSARATASSTISAPWTRAGPSPPRSASSACADSRIASSSDAPTSRVQAALAAAVAAPHPKASKPARRIRPEPIASEMRTRSPQEALPDSPTASGASTPPAPAGDARWRITSGG